MTFDISEEQRQLILMALGALYTQAPGFDHAMGEVAEVLKGTEQYEVFKVTRQNSLGKENTISDGEFKMMTDPKGGFK